MVRYSVIIPQHDRADEVRRQLPALAAVLDQLGQTYEMIVVDDGSAGPMLRLLEKLLTEYRSLRLLCVEPFCGLSVALDAGIRAARGEVLIALEPGLGYPPDQIPVLLSWLRRGDFVAGRRRKFGAAKLWHRISRIPRWALLGLDGHDPDCLFWAARREVFGELVLTAGTARYLPALVRQRGFRICEMYVEQQQRALPLQETQAHLGDLLAVWWHCRRWRNATVRELTVGGAAARPELRVVSTGDEMQPGSVGTDRPALGMNSASEVMARSVHSSPAVKSA
ncbi:MAG TPA: glycosyltransferase family 2 protein [Pirellulales bacterium]|jgi:glycosyltransferase involved in cell wall biosynthesis|nr:glycosyltransferase family 2 protein [Pirellulales bacterium]